MVGFPSPSLYNFATNLHLIHHSAAYAEGVISISMLKNPFPNHSARTTTRNAIILDSSFRWNEEVVDSRLRGKDQTSLDWSPLRIHDDSRICPCRNHRGFDLLGHTKTCATHASITSLPSHKSNVSNHTPAYSIITGNVVDFFMMSRVERRVEARRSR